MSFTEVIKDLQGQRVVGSRPLKMDTELNKLERKGKQELVKEIIKALKDSSYSNLVIHDALRTEDVFVSHSAI